jgi:spore coat polysaccharide biosynthesis predicted glycosyltransferase SpsG
VKESIKNSNLISKRYYLETSVNETINLENKNEILIKEDSNEFENNDFELIVNKAV